MSWRVTRDDVEQFRRELWKDERPLPARGKTDVFSKDCFAPAGAEREWIVLSALQAVGSEPLAPTPISLQGSVVEMSAAEGMRLFELLRALKALEIQRRDGRANDVRAVLVARQRQRLARIQAVLGAIAPQLRAVPYPLEEKINSLLQLLCRVMAIGMTRDVSEDLTRLDAYWHRDCCQIPFRDATPKNTIVTDPRLGRSSRPSTGEADVQCVAQLLDNTTTAFWESIPLIDVDFSSVEHLTAFEDDPISLHFHEWTFGSCPMEPTSLLLLPSQARANGYRAAAALVVRYLRFGGRKLAYRLVNAKGFEIRFRYDEPLFYFRHLPGLVEALSREFSKEYRTLLSLIARIGSTASNPSAADRGILSVDHFRRMYGQPGSYWPENPLELLVDE